MFSGTESYAKRAATRLHAAADLHESMCRLYGECVVHGPAEPAAQCEARCAAPARRIMAALPPAWA